ncbi:MAG: ABC transporter ATP-binding protein [Rhodobacteraceae bacterium]|nr:ABC transporter ATP-binding protein [Paracoccaceae bacterium]
MTVLIQAEGASVVHRVGPILSRQRLVALHPIDITIARGECLGLVGESGSGKSTLGSLLIGRQRPTTGLVRFEGLPLHKLGRQARSGRFGAVLQQPKFSLNPMLSVGDSLLEPLAILGQRPSGAQARRVLGESLERVGLPGEMQDRRPHQLSGGQRQRVSIARALISRPDFVLFDEAVSALDVSVQAQVLNLIRRLQKSDGFSALFISHDLAATRYICDRIAVLYAGRLMELGPAEAFYRPAHNPYSRGLQAASGLLDDQDAELRLDSKSLPQSGCALAPRCPQQKAICREREPPLLGQTHLSRCHFDAVPNATLLSGQRQEASRCDT